MNVSNSVVLVYDSPYLNGWFKDALNYSTLKERILNNELSSLPEPDRKPIGLYAIKHLPPAFKPYQNVTENHSFVYHYKANPDTFVYLQEVSPEEYRESRDRTLHDAAQLIYLGIYPDVGTIFHNSQSSRRYILFVDILKRLLNHSGDSGFNPAGGAGRAENPLPKFPNARKTGLTDWRDASLYETHSFVKDMQGLKRGTKGVNYFYQMNALSGVLLIDMLILAERYMHDEILVWHDDSLMYKFGLELAEGFAKLSAFYSRRPYENALRFSLECGIDWVRAARQIAFWLDTSPQGYPNWIAQGKVPPGLYEESIYIEVDPWRATNFTLEGGCRTNGELDRVATCNSYHDCKYY